MAEVSKLRVDPLEGFIGDFESAKENIDMNGGADRMYDEVGW